MHIARLAKEASVDSVSRPMFLIAAFQASVVSSMMSQFHKHTKLALLSTLYSSIKAEPFIWPTAAFINIHEHPL